MFRRIDAALMSARTLPRLMAGCVLVATALAAGAQGGPPDQVLARVNDQPVRRALLDEMLRSRQAPNPFDQASGVVAAPTAPVDRAQLFDELLLTELLAQQAVARGLHREPSITAQRELQVSTVLSQHVVRGLIPQVSVSPEEVAALYEEQVPPFDFKLQRLVSPTAAQATALIDRLQRGEAFAALARAQRGTAPAGDWQMFSQLEPAVATAVRHLKPGEVAPKPVAVDGGWAVLRLEARRSAPRPSLSEASVWLRQQLLNGKVQTRLDELRRAAKIEVFSSPNNAQPR